MQCMNCLRMEIDKKIVVKLIQALEDLKKSVKGVDIETKDGAPEEEIDLSDKIIVKSPIVGTAYLAPEPGGKKFILASYLAIGGKLDEIIWHPAAIYSNNFVGVFVLVSELSLNGIRPM